MKKLLLLLFSLAVLSVSASEPTKKYCELVGKGYPTKQKVKIEQANGDSEAYSVTSCTTMIDAVNALAKKGWKLEQAYAIVETQGMNRDAYFHYILSKEVETPKPQEAN